VLFVSHITTGMATGRGIENDGSRGCLAKLETDLGRVLRSSAINSASGHGGKSGRSGRREGRKGW